MPSAIRILLLTVLVLLVGVLDGVGQTPAAPDVVFNVTASRDSVGRGEPLTLYLSLTNKSNTTVQLTAVRLSDQVFRRDEQAEQAQQAKPLPIPTPLAPFDSVDSRIVITARDDARYAQYKFPLFVEYTWGPEGKYTSKQSATVTVDLKRRFDEEAKGFPGGTAAFLYLLLPIVPALLSYQVIDALRKKEGLKAPTFKSEHIAPAFMLAIVVSLLALIAANDDEGLDYSNPRIFITVLTVSALAGALVPGLRWLWALSKKRIWGFKRNDSLQAYLKKALSQLDPGEEFRWVQGKSDGELWEGLLLKQPDKTKVLGIQLQVFPKYPDGANEAARTSAWNSLNTEVVNEEGMIINSKELVRKVEAGEVDLKPAGVITRGGKQLSTGNIVAWEVDGFVEVEGKGEPKPLVMLVT